jgi:8-oxo-dGTP pyrophosphatase MutT (NUDIX family)
MDENALIKELDKKLPRKIIDGQEVLDFATSDIVPFVFGVLLYKDKLLLLKRSEKLGSFQGLWHIIAGYFDEIIPAESKMLVEAWEEAGYTKDDIERLEKKENVFIKRPDRQDWLVIPFVINLKTLKTPALNWEHTDYKWIDIKDLDTQEGLVPGDKDLITKLLI